MKAILRIYSLSLFSLLSITGILKAGNEPLIEKSKSYSKTYTVSASDKVSFNNQFGELKITTWSKNEIKVDVIMTGKANTEEAATAILESLSVEDGKNNSEVYFRTKIGKWKTGKKNNNTGFSINYVVFMPANNPLSIDNQFGNTSIGDYDGELSIRQHFGPFTGGKLGNVRSIYIEFSSGSSIQSINGGDINIKFSRTLISRVEGNVKANFEHCGGVKIGIDNSLKSLAIKNSFTELLVEASSGLSASFEVHTSFAEMNNNTNFPIKEKGEEDNDRGPKFDHDFSGKAGTGNIPVKIKSEFGEVKLGHNLPFDVNEKEEKKKTRSI